MGVACGWQLTKPDTVCHVWKQCSIKGPQRISAIDRPLEAAAMSGSGDRQHNHLHMRRRPKMSGPRTLNLPAPDRKGTAISPAPTRSTLPCRSMQHCSVAERQKDGQKQVASDHGPQSCLLQQLALWHARVCLVGVPSRNDKCGYHPSVLSPGAF